MSPRSRTTRRSGRPFPVRPGSERRRPCHHGRPAERRALAEIRRSHGPARVRAFRVACSRAVGGGWRSRVARRVVKRTVGSSSPKWSARSTGKPREPSTVTTSPPQTWPGPKGEAVHLDEWVLRSLQRPPLANKVWERVASAASRSSGMTHWSIHSSTVSGESLEIATKGANTT